MANGQERGVYRSECFNGVVEYHVYDSNHLLVCRIELLAGYANGFAEDRMATWLDAVDPPKGDGLTAPSVNPSLQTLASLAA